MAVETIYALFPTVLDAERAIGALMDRGVPSGSIGVISRSAAEQDEALRVPRSYERVIDRVDSEFGEPMATYRAIPSAEPPKIVTETVQPTSDVDTIDNVNTVGKTGITTTTLEDAKAGAAIGTGIGLVTGLLAAAAAITIPGFGPLLAGGALAAAFGGALGTTAAGAVAGGVVGYLRDMGMPDQAAEHYADRLLEGSYVISVVIDSSQYDEIKQILLKYNASGVDIDMTPTTPADVAAEWIDTPQAPVAVAIVSPAASETQTLVFDDVERRRIADVVEDSDTLPHPTRQFLTEAADGTPIIPAQVVESPILPITTTVHEPGVMLSAQTPQKSAIELQNAEIEEERLRQPLS